MRWVLLAAVLCLSSNLAWAASAPEPADWRALEPENTLYIDTTQGRIVVELVPETAPRAVERIKVLARRKFYDGLTFHRVINGFMAQTGDPLGTGKGGSELPDLAGEFEFRRTASTPFAPLESVDGRSGFVRTLSVFTQPDAMMQLTRDRSAAGWAIHCPGVVSMARASDPNSANSQFFLMRGVAAGLDHKYTAWGRVVWNQAAVEKLAVGEPPVRPDRMLTVRVAADLPAAEQAPLFVPRPGGAVFAAMLASRAKELGKAPGLCDIEFTARVSADASDKGSEWWRQIPKIP